LQIRRDIQVAATTGVPQVHLLCLIIVRCCYSFIYLTQGHGIDEQGGGGGDKEEQRRMKTEIGRRMKKEERMEIRGSG
jgi:hypothetical protein